MKTAQRIREYALKTLRDDFAEDETPPALLTAVAEAVSDEEVRHLGAALLARHDALSDAPYRHGGDRYDPELAVIATALGWTP